MQPRLIFLLFCLLLLPSALRSQPVSVSGIIINELYYDVTASNGGNWNGGASSSTEDQFIELYNDSDTDVNLRGWVITAATTFQFMFTDSLVLPAHRSLVLAKTIGTHTPPPGHLALTVAQAGVLLGTFGFSANGDCIFLINPGADLAVGGPNGDDEWMTFSYEGAADASVMYNGRTPNGTKLGHESDNKDVVGQSLNRNPDISGTAWEKHLSLNSSKACSPNRKVDGTSPLPVTFLRFLADWRPERRDILLRWTCDEFNSAGYRVERRAAGEDGWEFRGYQRGICAGRCIGDYSFSDSCPTIGGRLEYRIREIGSDGDAMVSPVVAVDVSQPGAFSVTSYPNPFGPSTGTTVRFEGIDPAADAPIEVDVRDQMGRRVRSLFAGIPADQTLTLRFDDAALPAGTYYCVLRAKTRQLIHPLRLLR